MSTRVHITIDTEFDIAGAFGNPAFRKPVGSPAVYCNINGRSEGLGFLLNTLNRYRIRATFFVEALNTCYFGDHPMRAIAREIANNGHDVQLHLHPCWTWFERPDWAESLATEQPNDDATRRSVEELVRLIEMGRAAFERWGMLRPTVLRTGGLRVGMKVYEAMRSCGMGIASNIGLAVYRPNEPELHLFSGCHELGGVMEFPVMTYSDFSLAGRTHYKTLTITGTSWPEMRSLLTRARDMGVSDVVVLTHPFEYVKRRDIDYEQLYLDRINRYRLERLCNFIINEYGFEAVCMSDLHNQINSSRNILINTSSLYALGRIFVNGINHAIIKL